MSDLAPEAIVRLEDDAVAVLDQRRLPDEVVELRCRSAAEVADAIRTLAVRGGTAITTPFTQRVNVMTDMVNPPRTGRLAPNPPTR